MSDDGIGKEQMAHAEDRLLHGLIEEAKRGDSNIAANLLWQFYWHVECGEPVPPHVLKYLAECFRGMLDDGIPAAEALHLDGSAPRPKPLDKKQRDKAIAQMVLMRANNDHHQGALERAKAWVEKETGFTPLLIETAYEQYRDELVAFHEEYGGWPIITRKPKKQEDPTAGS